MGPEVVPELVGHDPQAHRRPAIQPGQAARHLAEAIDQARTAGAHKVALQVWPHNAAAIALYERFGFQREGYLTRHYRRRSGELWDAVVMGLPLD